MAEAAQAEEALLTEASRHLIDAGGKRFRATLVLLAAQFGDPRDERIVPAAAAIELTHLATLFHDDVMDEASIRRGHESANSRWSNTIAILTGDFLFARASEHPGRPRCRGDQDPGADLHRAGERAGGGDPRAAPRPGSARPLPARGRGQDGVAHRHGGPFRCDVRRCPRRRRGRGSASASHAIGVAFQLSDDILDVASESAESGKEPGTDLREGVRSLPVLHALAAPAGRGRGPAARTAGARRPGGSSPCTRRRSRCCAPTRRWTRRARTWPAGWRWRRPRWPGCRTCPRGGRSRPSAISSWTAQADCPAPAPGARVPAVTRSCPARYMARCGDARLLTVQVSAWLSSVLRIVVRYAHTR